jgi:hypothetical protein
VVLEYEGVVEFCVYFGHEFGDLFAEDGFFLVAEQVFDLKVAVDDDAEVVADGVDCDHAHLLLADGAVHESVAAFAVVEQAAEFLADAEGLAEVDCDLFQEEEVVGGGGGGVEDAGYFLVLFLDLLGEVGVEGGEVAQFGQGGVGLAELVPVLRVVLRAFLHELL